MDAIRVDNHAACAQFALLQNSAAADKSYRETLQAIGLSHVGEVEVANAYKVASTFLDAPTRPKTLREIGVLGPEQRFMDGSMTRVHAPLLLHPATLDLDGRVQKKMGFGASDLPVPSVYLVGSATDVGQRWTFCHGKTGNDLVALVALTPVTFTYFPCTKEAALKWSQYTLNGEASKQKHPKDNVLSDEFMRTVHATGMETFQVSIDAGSVFVTYAGVPFCLETEKPDVDETTADKETVAKLAAACATTYMVKTILFSDTVAPDLWIQTLQKGFWTAGKFGENIFYKRMNPANKDKPANIEPTALDAASWLETAVLHQPPPSPASAAPSPVKAAVASPLNAASTTTSAAATGTHGKDTSKATNAFAALDARHDALLERIAKISPLAWDPEDEVNARTKRDTRAEKRQYDTALKTLEKNVAKAEQVDVAPTLAQLNELKTVLDEMSKAERNGKEQKTYNKLAEDYTAWSTATNNLVPKKSKHIEDALAKARALHSAIDTRLASANQGKKRARPPSAADGAPSGAAAVVATIIVPSVDDIVVEPRLVNGPDEIKPIFKDCIEAKAGLQNMVQKLNNPAANALFDRLYNVELTAITNQVKQKATSFDIGALIAFKNALTTLYNETKNGNAPAVAATATAASSRAECAGCDEKKVILEDGFCRDCYVENVLDPYRARLENRTDKLSREAKKEKDPKGPLTVRLAQWTELEEELEQHFEKMSKSNAGQRQLASLKLLMAKAEAILPPDAKKGKAENGAGLSDDEDEEYEGDDDDDDDEQMPDAEDDGDGDSMIDDGPEPERHPNGMPTLRNLPSDEEEAAFSDEESGTRTDERSGLAAATLVAMARVPNVSSFQRYCLDAFKDKSQHASLRAAVEKVGKATETWRVDVQSRNETNTGWEEPVPQLDFHLTEEEARKVAAALTIRNVTKVAVVRVPLGQ